MKKVIILISILVVIISCDKYPYPGTETLEMLSFNVVGNNQSAEAENYLTDSIGIVYNYESVSLTGDNSFSVEFEVVAGGGMVEQTILHSNSSGKIFTRWKLGNESNDQKLIATIYDSEGKFLTQAEIEATAFFMGKLNTITKGFLVGINDMVCDTVNYRSMLISGRDIYINKDKFYDWKPISFSYNTTLSELEINSKGEIFGGGRDGNLYKSTDWGQNWTRLPKPIPEHNYSFQLSISKDDHIWVSRWDLVMHCSTDGGLTWQKDTTNTASDSPLGPVYLFNDTSHLSLALDVKQTFDGGVTWKTLNNPQYPSTLFVTDKNEIIVQGQEGGFTLYKSVDSGETYKKVLSPIVAYGTTSWHCYDKFKNYYYVLAPGGGVWKTKDFEEFEELITFETQRNLFIDHRGTIYAGGFNYANAEDDPTLILPGND